MQANLPSYDVAVVGSGFTGVAHAYWAAKHGLRVAVFERHASANGHSMRQPGLVCPLREPEQRLERAIRSRHTWLQLADTLGFYAERQGGLLLAHSDLEMAVLEEFGDIAINKGYRVQRLSAEGASRRCPQLRTEELVGALFSATEVNIDPRQALRVLHAYLAEELGVCLHYQVPITEVEPPFVYSGRQRWRAEHVVVCGGYAEDLYRAYYPTQGWRTCKLQYLRTQPQPVGWRLGPNLLTGLSLPRFGSFGECPSMPLLRRYFTERLPAYSRWGIDLSVSQTVLGEINIGESHEYGDSPTPFDRREINELLLRYLHRIIDLPNPRIQETWHSLQRVAPPAEDWAILQPVPGVTLVNGLGDSELTNCFGIAQDLVLADFQLPDQRLTA